MTTELQPRDESVRETVVQIQESKEVTGKFGQQWELKVRWPWMTDPKHEATVWVNVSDVPRCPPPGLYNVLIAHKSLVQAKQGTHDGSRDFMWHWSILKFVSKADAMPTQTPAASGNGPQSPPQRVRDDGSAVFRTKEELRWTEAYHMAARVAWSSEMEFTPGWQDYLSAWAGWFYNELAAVDAPAAEPDPEIYGEPAYVNMDEPEMPPPVADAEEPGDTLPF